LNEDGDKFLTLNNHIVLVNSFRDPIVSFIDPEKGEVKTENLENILDFMHKVNKGFFGLLKRV
jgi:hypothetical protein